MPPYSLYIAASFTASVKDLKDLGASPKAVLVLSVKETLPNNEVKISAATPDETEWPDGYSGKGGVPIKDFQPDALEM